MGGKNYGGWRTWTTRSPDAVDRVLVGLCALIWLILLGFSVAAIVALVDLGRGFHEPSHNTHTGLLYIVIGVSALIILAAIPVLLRARQATPATPARSGQRVAHAGFYPAELPGRQGGAAARKIMPNAEAVERILLRGFTALAGAIGLALTGVAVGTYLMAVGKDGAAWTGYVIAGIVTVAMPVLGWLHLRWLNRLLSA